MYMQFRFFDIFGIIKMFSGKELDLIGTFSPFWLLSMTATGCKNGLFIFIFRQFFKNMPKEIEEAAMVDGAGAFKTFSGIMLPNAVTPMVTVALFSFVWQYNDVVYSTVFMPFGKLLPLLYRNLERLTTQVYSLLGLTGDDLTMIFYIAIIKSAGVLMMLAPVILIFLIFQRFFVESVERSGITGQ
jgi:multiple sugar transport system permease protein